MLTVYTLRTHEQQQRALPQWCTDVLPTCSETHRIPIKRYKIILCWLVSVALKLILRICLFVLVAQMNVKTSKWDSDFLFRLLVGTGKLCGLLC